MFRSAGRLLALLLVAVFASVSCSGATKSGGVQSGVPWLYVVDAGGQTSRIVRVRTDGTGMQTVLDSIAPASRGIVLEPNTRTMIWASRDGDRIQRARIEASGLTLTSDLPTQGLDSAYAMVFDRRRGHLYWSDYGTGAIHRANLDGKQPRVIVRGLVAPRGMDIDTVDGWLYWSDIGTHKVQRARLNGSEVQDLLSAQHGLDQPYGVTLDARNRFIYITDAGTGHILRARPDGSEVQILIPQSGPHPSFLIVAENEGRMYWGDNRANRVRRARLDGTQIEDVIAGGLAGPRGMVLVRD